MCTLQEVQKLEELQQEKDELTIDYQELEEQLIKVRLVNGACHVWHGMDLLLRRLV
jgi:hypothetical protein